MLVKCPTAWRGQSMSASLDRVFAFGWKLNWRGQSDQGDRASREVLFLASGVKQVDCRLDRIATETHVPHSPEQLSGKQCWLRDPVRPCVFWVITGFGIPSAGRGHAVETGVLEPVPRWGPILLLLFFFVLLVLLLSFILSLSLCSLTSSSTSYSVCFNMSEAKPLPLRNSLCLFLLSAFCSFISSFFYPSWLSRFLCHFYLTPWCSSFLTHFFMLLSCHIIGLNARLFEKITGVTLHCLDCQTKEQRPAA